MGNNNTTFLTLKELSFFSKFSDDAIKLIFSCSKILSLKRNQLIYLEGDKAEYCYVIMNGGVKLFNHTITGSEFVVRLPQVGDMFGENALGSTQIHSSCAESTTTNSTILAIPAREIKNLIAKHNYIERFIMDKIFEYQRDLENLIQYLTVMNSSQRIAHYLLDNIAYNSICNSTLKLNHNKSLIATFLGMKPETFSRALRKLRNINVFFRGKYIVVGDVSRLKAFCHDDHHNILHLKRRPENDF